MRNSLFKKKLTRYFLERQTKPFSWARGCSPALSLATGAYLLRRSETLTPLAARIPLPPPSVPARAAHSVRLPRLRREATKRRGAARVGTFGAPSLAGRPRAQIPRKHSEHHERALADWPWQLAPPRQPERGRDRSITLAARPPVLSIRACHLHNPVVCTGGRSPALGSPCVLVAAFTCVACVR